MNKYLDFWEKEASKLPWRKKWDKPLEWSPPHAKWFVGGEINASEACIDLNIEQGLGQKPAIIWEGENGENCSISYVQLKEEVEKWASQFKDLSINRGDFVTLYMPLTPEAIFAMLACARIGAVHNVVFAGFSSQSLEDRVRETNSKIIITSECTYRRGKKINLKETVNEAIKHCPSVKHVLYFKRTNEKISKTPLDVEFGSKKHEKIEPVSQNSIDPLFILYTSGTTGKPKGILHSTGGYLTHIYATLKWAFDINRKDIFWCTADIGWITGHSYVVYAPLMHGATTFIYEGVPDYPQQGKWWELIDKYKITKFYTSPTAIRMLQSLGDEWPEKFSLNSLKILGSVGEPINPEAWQWFFEKIGKSKLPIIDTWWQTETGGFMIAPQASTKINKLIPGSAQKPLPGISASVVDKNGNKTKPDQKGYLVIDKPWPGMLLGIYKNQARYKETYWSKFPEKYFAGDYATIDKEGYFYILGRSDEVIITAGHNISTIELENATVEVSEVPEAGAIGVKDEIKGQKIIIFAVGKESEDLKKKIINSIRREVGPIAVPAEIVIVEKLPKTRSGKILRRLLRKIYEGEDIGDTTTLEDSSVIEAIQNKVYKVKG